MLLTDVADGPKCYKKIKLVQNYWNKHFYGNFDLQDPNMNFVFMYLVTFSQKMQ